jgi:hypothetical protein
MARMCVAKAGSRFEYLAAHIAFAHAGLLPAHLQRLRVCGGRQNDCRILRRQDLENPLNGCSFDNAKSLIEQLQALADRPPFFCELEGHNGYTLLVGLGRSWSCVQYSRTDGQPPYWMALSPDHGASGDDLCFLIGGTATPIRSHYRLSFDTVEEMVSHFVETGERGPLLEWEEI